MRWVARIGTALLLLVLLAAPPVGFAVWAADRTWRVPTGPQIAAWVDDPLTGTTIAAGAIAAGGLLWLLLAAATIRVLTTRTRTSRVAATWRRLRRLPLPTPAQATASSMAGAALFAIPGLTTPTHHAPPPPPGTATGEQPTTPAHGDTTTDPSPPPHDTLPTETAAEPVAGTADTVGVTLADGSWLPATTAHTVSVLTGLIWLRRRRDYHPATTTRPDRDDDLHPTPPTAGAITAAIAPPVPAAARTAVIDTDRPISLHDLPQGILAFTGPGAAAAARGLIVTAVLAHATAQPHAARLTTTTDDLASLLGAASVPPALPGVTLTAPAPPVAGHIDRQYRLTVTADTASGSHRQTVIIVGAPTADRTWHIEADGTITGNQHATERRLCVLTPQAATDLLTLAGSGQYPSATSADRRIPPSEATPTPQPERGSDTAGLSSRFYNAAGAPATRARLVLLGDCRITADGHTVAIQRSAALQTLAYLAVHPEGATTHQLITAIWPGLAPATITHRLYTTLADLRRDLRPYTSDTTITRRGDRYLLDPDHLDVDLWHLHAAAATATTALTNEQRHHANHAITRLYTGDLAAGHTWAWLEPPRTALRRDVIDAYTRLADVADPVEALALLHAAAAVDPYNQHLHHRAVQLLHILGREDEEAALHHIFTQRLEAAGLAVAIQQATTGEVFPEFRVERS